MNKDTKILLTIGGLTLAIVVFIVFSSGPANQKVDSANVNRGGVATGSANPKLTLVEFSDFFCPACKAVNPFVENIIEKYGSDIKFIYRNFPLPQHPLAVDAAKASLAASIQGEFWPYRNLLFANQENLKTESFEELAKNLNLDLSKFRQDLQSKDVNQILAQDIKDSRDLNLNSTPTFFLDGEKVELNSFTDLIKSVETKLKEL